MLQWLRVTSLILACLLTLFSIVLYLSLPQAVGLIASSLLFTVFLFFAEFHFRKGAEEVASNLRPNKSVFSKALFTFGYLWIITIIILCFVGVVGTTAAKGFPGAVGDWLLLSRIFTSNSPFALQQVGTIAELNVAKLNSGDIDWFNPRFTFTYDNAKNPPNGTRNLMLLTDYMSESCKQGGSCSTNEKILLKLLKPHLVAPNDGSISDTKASLTTLLASVKETIRNLF